MHQWQYRTLNSCNFILELLLPEIKVSGSFNSEFHSSVMSTWCRTGSSEGFEFRGILTDPIPLYENKTYKVCFNTLKNKTEGYLALLELATLFCLPTNKW